MSSRGVKIRRWVASLNLYVLEFVCVCCPPVSFGFASRSTWKGRSLAVCSCPPMTHVKQELWEATGAHL